MGRVRLKTKKESLFMAGLILTSCNSKRWMFSAAPVLIILILMMVLLQSCAPPKHFASGSVGTDPSTFGKNILELARQDENFKFDYFDSTQGGFIRFGKSIIKSPDGIIIIATGQSEFIESYFELVRDLNRRGFSVWIMDWKGQGGSNHALEDDSRATNDFTGDQRDLRRFILEIVVNTGGTPTILLAHSMGGHIALRMLEQDPDTVDIAILTAPMVTVKTGSYPHSISAYLAETVSNFGFGWWYAPGHSAWVPNPNYKHTDNQNTSDPDRSLLKEYWRYNEAHARKSYGVTFGWFHNYSKSRNYLLKGDALSNIRTDILMTVPLIDVLISPEESLDACSKISSCTHITYKNSRHEIYLERDNIRDTWLRDITEWIREKTIN